MRPVGFARNTRDSSVALGERVPAIRRIVTVGLRQQSGWLASPCWSTVMSTTHGSPADSPLGTELSCTVAQPPASAVLAHTSASAATTMSGLRTFDLLARMPDLHRSGAAGSGRRSHPAPTEG